jgi:hypothetical protein
MELSSQLHAPAALSPEKEPLVLIGYETGCVSREGRSGEKKNPVIALAGNWTTVVQPVT